MLALARGNVSFFRRTLDCLFFKYRCCSLQVKHVEAPISVASSTHSVRSDPDDMSDKIALNQNLCSSLEPRALSASTSASVHHSHGHNYSYLHPHRHAVDMPRPQHAPASSVHVRAPNLDFAQATRALMASQGTCFVRQFGSTALAFKGRQY